MGAAPLQDHVERLRAAFVPEVTSEVWPDACGRERTRSNACTSTGSDDRRDTRCAGHRQTVKDAPGHVFCTQSCRSQPGYRNSPRHSHLEGNKVGMDLVPVLDGVLMSVCVLQLDSASVPERGLEFCRVRLSSRTSWASPHSASSSGSKLLDWDTGKPGNTSTRLDIRLTTAFCVRSLQNCHPRTLRDLDAGTSGRHGTIVRRQGRGGDVSVSLSSTAAPRAPRGTSDMLGKTIRILTLMHAPF